METVRLRYLELFKTDKLFSFVLTQLVSVIGKGVCAMSDSLTKSYEKKKDDLIGKLLDRGIFKTNDHQLYELSLSELEHTYKKLSQAN